MKTWPLNSDGQDWEFCMSFILEYKRLTCNSSRSWKACGRGKYMGQQPILPVGLHSEGKHLHELEWKLGTQ